jgi:hypothetical protein
MAFINVIYPNGGEEWTLGGSYSILWDSEGVAGNVRIWLARAGGGSVIIADSVPNDGSHRYTVPEDLLIHHYKVAVETVDHQIADFSDHFFRISRPAAAYIKVISPNGREVWTHGDTTTILWESGGIAGNVDIWLARAGGGSVTLAEGTPNSGSFDYIVPDDLPSDHYKVAIETPDHQIIDYSDDWFRVVPSAMPYINVLAPNGGEVWAHGEAHTLRWKSQDITGNVRLWLARAGGGSVIIAADVSNTGTYQYTVPADLLPAPYKLTVETTDHQFSDQSDDFFLVATQTAHAEVHYTYDTTGSDWVCRSVSCVEMVNPGEAMKFSIEGTANQPDDHTSETVFVEVILASEPRYSVPAPSAKYQRSYYDGVKLHREPLTLSLTGAKSVKLEMTLHIPDDTPLGSYHLGVIVDAGNLEIEREETKNIGFCAVRVDKQCPGGSLIISDSGTRDHNRCIWDWTQPIYQIYIRGEMELLDRDSPWHGTTEPMLEQNVPDNRPEDGWRLLAKDFGTGNQPLDKLPYFVLYNKYTAKIRIFFFVPSTWSVSEHTDHPISLFFPPGESDKTLVLNIGGEPSYATDFTQRDALRRVRMGLTHLVRGNWSYADFSVAYDPITERMRSPRLRFEVDGYDLIDFFAEGTIAGTARTFTVKEDEPFGELKKILEEVESYYSEASKIKSELDKRLNDTNRKASTTDRILNGFGLLPGAEDGNLTSIGQFMLDNLGVLGALAGLVSGIWNLVTGSDSKPPVTTFEAGIKIRGRLETKSVVDYRTLRLPGALPTGDNAYPQEAPIYDRPLGVFALTTSPVLVYEGVGPGAVGHPTCVAINNLDYIINPNSHMRLRELYAAILYIGDKSEGSQLERLEEPPEDTAPISSGWVPYDPDYPLHEANPPKVRVYRTPYVPFDRFQCLYFNIGAQIYAYDSDTESPRPPLIYPFQIKGVKLLGVLERTDAANSEDSPLVHTFSYVFQPYITKTVDVIREERGEKDPGWAESFDPDTVGRAVHDYFGWGWFDIIHETPSIIRIRYSHAYRAMQRHVGNLVILHEKVDCTRPQRVFRRFEEKQFGFVEYRVIDHFHTSIDKRINGAWQPTGIELTWNSKPYALTSGPSELEYVRQTLGYDPGAHYWSASDSMGVRPGNHKIDEPGRYRIRIVAWSEGGDYHEQLQQEFQVVE